MQRLGLLAALLFAVQYAWAETAVVEEVVVTGSYIKGSPEDAASPVDTITRNDFNLQGNPSLVEFIKRTPSITGVDGDTNTFQSNGLVGVSNVNLRGLGPGRTLPLLNGARLAPSPRAVAESGQQFVNINAIPDIAIGRVELLKDGASSTYGSDAIAGVINFITRSDFRGIEVKGSWTDIDGADDDGNHEFGIIAGFGTDRLDVIAAFSYQERSRINTTERDWTLTDFADNPRGGVSGFGSPGTFIGLAGGRETDNCAEVGGILTAGPTCRFRFQDFFNLADHEEHTQAYVEANYQFNDRHSASFEFLYGEDEALAHGSPTYPPQVFTDTDRSVVPGMPHFDDFIARQGLQADPVAGGAMVFGRFVGVAGPAVDNPRDYESMRVRFGLEGELTDSISYFANLTYGESELELTTPDTLVDKAAWAYRGLGGHDCDQAAILDADPTNDPVPGQGDCLYYNPFTTGFTASNSRTADPNFVVPGSQTPALNNSQEVLDYMVDRTGATSETELLVFDFVISGESNVVAQGGNVGWALGLQYRDESLDVENLPISDIGATPCAFGLTTPLDTFTIPAIDLGGGNATLPYTYTCPFSPSGPFHFLTSNSNSSSDQDIYAFFGEINVPFTENLEMQAAIRYEDYGGDIGDTVDPKVAVRWQATETLALRGSMSTSFRAPSLNQTTGTTTSLQFVAPTGAFKAVDTLGDPTLQPESATTTNFGIIYAPTENVIMTLDYWTFDFEDTLVLENFNAITSTCFDPTSAFQGEACGKIIFQDPANPSLADVQRVSVGYRNGPDQTVSGLDWNAEWDIPTDVGVFTLGTAGTFVSEFDVDQATFITTSDLDAVGELNRFESVARSMPEMKASVSANWNLNNHNIRIEAWYTSEYDDSTEPAGKDWSIDSHTTVDVHYNGYFMEEKLRLFASVINIADEDPPYARLDLQYDPYTHNAYGRMIKVGLQYTFEGGVFQ